MTKAKLYFDGPALAWAMLEHAGERALAPIAGMAGEPGFDPASLLSFAPIFGTVRDSVRAWCAANHMKPGFWTHDATVAREAVLFLGQYLAGIVDVPIATPGKLARYYADHKEDEALSEARRFFDRQLDRMSVFDYGRPIAQTCSASKSAMRAVAAAYGEAGGFDGVQAICPAIRHEAAGLILDSLEKSFNPSIF